MSAAASLELFPKFSTLVSTDATTVDYTSLPMDVSQFTSAQFQVWRGKIAGGGALFSVFLEESLDGLEWSPPPAGAAGIDPGQETRRLFSYAFRQRWFRVRIRFRGSYVTCWAVGLLR